ncbi:metal-binding protein [Halobacteriales archaeon QS_6_64_34]|nr:MAG: metal-binding protein [Halobacteriales archaeon QS_6_64_34]
MKKQELIHLHGLLAQVQNHYEAESGSEVEHDEYAELGVKPTSIHKSKTDHKAAVFAIANGITAEMTTEEKEPVSAAAD